MFASCYHLRFVPASQPKPLRVHSSYPGAFTGAPVAACAHLRFFCRGSRCAAPRSCSPRLGRSLLSRRGLSVAFTARILFSSQPLSYSIRFYPRKNDLSRGTRNAQPSFYKKSRCVSCRNGCRKTHLLCGYERYEAHENEIPIITGLDNACRDSAAPDTWQPG